MSKSSGNIPIPFFGLEPLCFLLRLNCLKLSRYNRNSRRARSLPKRKRRQLQKASVQMWQTVRKWSSVSQKCHQHAPSVQCCKVLQSTARKAGLAQAALIARSHRVILASRHLVHRQTSLGHLYPPLHIPPQVMCCSQLSALQLLVALVVYLAAAPQNILAAVIAGALQTQARLAA